MEALQAQIEELQHMLLSTASCSNYDEVNIVNVKLLPFWKDKLSLWFAQTDVQLFSLGNVKQKN